MGKKQHYIPRVLLNNFSVAGDGKEIGIYLTQASRVVPNGDLKNQCYRINLYGADQVLEKVFCDIEGQTASVFRKLLAVDLDLAMQEEATLRTFLAFQLGRTPQAEKNLQQVFEKQMKYLARDVPNLAGKLDSVKIGLKNPFYMLAQISSEIAPVLSDLKTALVLNSTSEPWIVGQNPLLVLNPFLDERKWFGPKNGLAAKGAILFLPLSPSIAVILYDRNRYGLASQKKVVEASLPDVERINYFQFAQTENCVYFQTFGSLETLSKYNAETSEYRAKDKSIVRVFRSPDKKRRGELLQNLNVGLPGAQKFDFVCLKNRALYEVIEQRTDISRESILPVLQHLERDRGMDTIPMRTQELIRGKPFILEEEL
jgi:hypothetical protein